MVNESFWEKHYCHFLGESQSMYKCIGELTITSLLWHGGGRVYQCLHASLSNMMYSTSADCQREKKTKQ